MLRPAAVVLLVSVIASALACSNVGQQPAPDAAAPVLAPPGATLLEGLGNYHRVVTAARPEAQRWFDQGLILSYGFNHDAAERSFLKAVEIDPDCAMCWWGAALVLGPHVNAAMDPANSAKAWMRAQKARSLAPRAAPWEQGFIDALAARYAENPPADRTALDQAYAEAMAALVKKLPDDLDAATLHAEALMDLQPWNYYDRKGAPIGKTRLIVSTLESVMARDANHAGALHLYIHAVEASSKADRGAAAADRLRELVPGSGHLVHMPAHIYTRVGRYHDAAVANEKAIAADNAYLAACRPAPGIYPLGYVPHNHHFLWWASSMEGASARALAAAEETAKRANLPDLIGQPGFEFLQDFAVTPLKAQVQFGKWDQIVATKKPELAYPLAVWHFAQGMAAVRQNRLFEAQDHLQSLAQAASDPAFEKYMVGPQHALSRTLKVAERILAGEFDLATRRHSAAIVALRMAVAEEDANHYFEPPLWHQPARHYLGAALLAAGKPRQAEAVYREDLKRNRDNGWSLQGLAQSLRAQGRKKEAADVEARQTRAWQHADIKLTASVL